MGNKPVRPVIEYLDAQKRLTQEELTAVQVEWQDLVQRSQGTPGARAGCCTPAMFVSRGIPQRFGQLGPAITKRILEVVAYKHGKTLDFEEYLCWAYATGFGSEEQQLRFLFNLFDTGASEQVSKSQFKSVSTALLETHANHAQFGSKAFAKTIDAYVWFAFYNYDTKNDRFLSFGQWCRFADEDETVQLLLRLMGRRANPAQQLGLQQPQQQNQQHPPPIVAYVPSGATPIVE